MAKGDYIRRKRTMKQRSRILIRVPNEYLPARRTYQRALLLEGHKPGVLDNWDKELPPSTHDRSLSGLVARLRKDFNVDFWICQINSKGRPLQEPCYSRWVHMPTGTAVKFDIARGHSE